MDERQPIGEIIGVRELYGNVAVFPGKTGARMVWSDDYSELRVNTALFPDEDFAKMAILQPKLQAWSKKALKRFLFPSRYDTIHLYE